MTAPEISARQLDSLLPHTLLDQLALTYKVDARNQIRLFGKLVFLCLLHNLPHHKDLTLRLPEETYEQKVGHHADHSSFGTRLAVIKPAYFEAIFRYLHAKMAPVATVGETQALKLRFVDATTVTLSAKRITFGLLVGTCAPDKSHRHIKSVPERSDDLPRLLHVCKEPGEPGEPGENGDIVALGATMARHTQPGDLWVFDKGCSSRERLLDLHLRKAFFLTPQSQQAIKSASHRDEAQCLHLSRRLVPDAAT